MENRWLLSAPMPLSANKSTLEIIETKIQRKLFIAISKTANILEHFGKMLRQQQQQQKTI